MSRPFLPTDSMPLVDNTYRNTPPIILSKSVHRIPTWFHASLSYLTFSPINQERRICMKKHLDICHLSGQLGISSKQLQEWLNGNGLATTNRSDQRERRDERVESPYRLAAPASLSLAFSSRPSICYRGRLSRTGSDLNQNPYL